MKGHLYAYFSTEDGRRAYRHGLWIPEAKLLFQWVPMGDVKQVFVAESFPPAHGVSGVVENGDCEVSPEVIEEARRYLAQEKHLDAQQGSVVLALERIAGKRRVNEARAQERFKFLRAEG